MVSAQLMLANNKQDKSLTSLWHSNIMLDMKDTQQLFAVSGNDYTASLIFHLQYRDSVNVVFFCVA